MKPLFIPLKTEFFDAFESGEKLDELRLYGPRWNESTCPVGREVVLSKGYGKQNRLKGVVGAFRKQHGTWFDPPDKASIKAIYGTLDVEIAVITPKYLKRVQP